MTAFEKPPEGILSELKDVVGQGGWKQGIEASRYFEDPRGRFSGGGILILMPASTAEVSTIVRICSANSVGLIPYSGGTGVVAGQISIENDNAVIISLERMNNVREVLIDDGAIVVEAGCILEQVHNVASEHDLMFPLSMASKGSCCIGGNLATNAGGIQVVRHGNARDLCIGIEAVLPCGSIYSDLKPLRKNNTGYDLKHLLIGSEGTLGIITAATLVVKPVDPETITVFCAIASPQAALSLYKMLKRGLGESISALELMSGFGVDLVTTHFPGLTKPFTQNHDWYLLFEASGYSGFCERAEAVLSDCFDQELLYDAVIAQSQSQQKNLWDLRENTPEANRAGGAFCNSDTSVPISKVDDFICLTKREIEKVEPRLQINTYGHIGDGNIHHNVLPPKGVSKDKFLAEHPDMVQTVRMVINETTHRFGGSISAEHGVGRLKVDDIQIYGDRTKLEALKRIKLALDPTNIMNPGAILNMSNM